MATPDVTGGAVPLPRKVKMALCQLPVGKDKEENTRLALSAIEEAAGNGAALVVLPEMWSCPYSNDAFPSYAEPLGGDGRGGPSGRAMSDAAARHGVTLVGGSIPERVGGGEEEQGGGGAPSQEGGGGATTTTTAAAAAAAPQGAGGGRLYNTCCVYGPDGALLAKHRKVHLFDIDIPGKMTFRESDTLSRGEALTMVDTPAGRLGVGICYDIRFPEMAMEYAARGAQLLLYPGAFNMVTGPAHWRLLLQARAVDNQLFVAGCAPARNPDSGFTAWAHSAAVGPFAELLAAAGEGAEVVYAELDYAQIPERRANMPFQAQKRPDLYRVLGGSSA